METHEQTPASLIAIGKIVRSHGIRGGVRIYTLTENTDQFSSFTQVYVGLNEANVTEMNIDRTTHNRNQLTAYFVGCETRNDADALVGQFVFVPESMSLSVTKKPGNSDDLIGMQVVSDDRLRSGVLRDIWNYPANDVYVAMIDGKEVLIPAVPDFILEIDRVERVLIVKSIPGLFEVHDEN